MNLFVLANVVSKVKVRKVEDNHKDRKFAGPVIYTEDRSICLSNPHPEGRL